MLGHIIRVLTLLVGALLVLAVSHADARVTAAAVPDISARALPQEARDVLARIRSGAPFRYDRDGAVFGNRERRLPAMPRGHYREYTVATPGERTRGARRIVCGGRPPSPQACYYTDDHYQSFRRIRE